MEITETLSLIWTSVVSVLLFCAFPLVFSLIAGLVISKCSGKERSEKRSLFGFCFFAAFSFGVLAMCISVVMAASREPAVPTVVPAALSLIGGIALFLIDEADKGRIVVAAVSAFSVMFLFGAFLGSDLRYRAEQRVEI